MHRIITGLAFLLLTQAAPANSATPDGYGPAAALAFAESYKGSTCKPGALYCYPDAKGIPLADAPHIIPLTASLWTPAQLIADFQQRMKLLPPTERKQGIIVMLKTERCATKSARACTITTAALEKHSTPLVGQFLVYGVQLKPRDGDKPPGSLLIETGADAWKNQAAGEYKFLQGPGATLVFLNPVDGSKITITDAEALDLMEPDFLKNQGRTPQLEKLLQDVLKKLHAANRS